MASNEIKTLQFNQGVELDNPPVILDDSGVLDLSNNVSNQTLLVATYDIATIREIIIDYQIYRRTDTPYESIETGQIRFSARPEQATQADKWLLKQLNKEDEGIRSGITIGKSVTSGVLTTQYSSTNVAGANHSAKFFYSIKALTL
jgi:hypothetical protein